jgi:hypothetical protein
MFAISPGGELVGYSEWPWDRLYAPVVGCFASGRLQAIAVCDEEPQRVGLKGPPIRCWFRMRVAPDILRKLTAEDPDVQLGRLEDGAPVKRAGGQGAVTPDRSRLIRVEDLLSGGEAFRPTTLDGFPTLLTAPVPQQVDCMYLDILGRPVDPGGYGNYGVQVENGQLSLLQLRKALMASEEFVNRRVTIAERVGALVTSHMWLEFSSLDSPGQRFRPLPAFRISDYASLDTEGFVSICYELLLSRVVDPVGMAHYSYMAENEGRLAVAVELSREAAHRGVFLDVMA